MADLSEQVALVRGASRGVGRGVALGLAHAGAKVFATGRSIKQAELSSDIRTNTGLDGAWHRDAPRVSPVSGCLV